jgi:hypothetical protein
MAVGAEAHGHPDAADLIAQMHRESPPEMTAAMQRHKDPEATAALDMGDLSGRLGVKVLTAAVYGLPDQDQKLVYLYEDDAGRTHRWYEDYEGGPAPTPEQQAPVAPGPAPGQPEVGSEPWDGYDEQSVAEITTQLGDLSDEDLDALAAYEASHKNRKGVMDAVEAEKG